MNKVHTLIISPKYRPYNDGLSDYTFYFLNELRKNKSLNFTLLTSNDEKIKNYVSDDHGIFPNIENWNGLDLLLALRLVRNQDPENILVQYVPTMYGRAGINFFFPWLLLFFRIFMGKKIILMAHELYYPFEKNGKGAFIFFFHIWNLFLLSLASTHILTTTENFVKILKRFPFNKKKVSQLVVGSNISREKVNSAKTSLDKINLVFFGSLHPSREPGMIFNALNEYFEKEINSKINVVVIGSQKTDITALSDFKDTPSFHWEKFTFHGKLNEVEVARKLHSCHFSLNYFIDGISARRGSAMAALNLGLPIITNFTERSDSLFLNQKCILMSGDKSNDFKHQLHEQLKIIELMNISEYENLQSDAFQFYNKNFSWNIIISKYFELTKDRQ